MSIIKYLSNKVFLLAFCILGVLDLILNRLMFLLPELTCL